MSAPGMSGRWLALVAGVVVVATVAAAIAVMGPPWTQREARFDRRRVEDLERIVDAIARYAETHDALPPDLATLARQPGLRLAIADPKNQAPYAYEVTGARSYRLCATFATDTAAERAGFWTHEDWSHGAGRQCFDRRRKPAAPAQTP